MKTPRTLLLLGLVTFAALFIIFNRESDASASNEDTAKQKKPSLEKKVVTPSKRSSVDLDSLIREVSAQVPRKPNSAGHVIIASADTSDEDATDALLRSFARGEDHLNHMRRENAFVTRRQIVELPQKFADIGNQIQDGESIKEIILPDFDGGTFKMEYNPHLMGPAGDSKGTLLGNIPEEEASNVSLGYYENATYGYVNLPSLNRVLEYVTVGGNQIVVKEIDLEARNIAEPCLTCQQAHGNSTHPAGAAHNFATDFGQKAPED